MIWLGIASIAAFALFLEDFRWRMVHLYWYPLLLIGLGGVALQEQRFSELLFSALINLIFVFLLLLLLTMYFSVKEKRFVYLFDTYLGWGDVLFFLVIVVYFNLEQYILFTVGSLAIALLLSPLIFRLQGRNKQVPLAGIQAACLLIYSWLSFFNIWRLPTWISV